MLAGYFAGVHGKVDAQSMVASASVRKLRQSWIESRVAQRFQKPWLETTSMRMTDMQSWRS